MLQLGSGEVRGFMLQLGLECGKDEVHVVVRVRVWVSIRFNVRVMAKVRVES